ncbi:MAG: hypothetical protein WBK51_04590 [Polaromonas sp.]
MLRSFSAELNGAELIWLDQPPANLSHARVLVVVDDEFLTAPPMPAAKRYEFADLAGKLQWRGDAVKAQRGQRDAW